MPTYDYECGACGHAFEKFQSISAKPLTKCPNCDKKKLRRLIGTGAGFIFKGSGFYQTDYRSRDYKKAAEADGKPSSTDGEKTTSDSSSAQDKSKTSKSESSKSESSKSEPPKSTD